MDENLWAQQKMDLAQLQYLDNMVVRYIFAHVKDSSAKLKIIKQTATSNRCV